MCVSRWFESSETLRARISSKAVVSREGMSEIAKNAEKMIAMIWKSFRDGLKKSRKVTKISTDFCREEHKINQQEA